MKEIVCPNCSQNIKVVDTMGHDLYLENLKEQDKEIDRLNNDIKILLKENEAKEKIIKKQDYIINELEKYIKTEAKVELYGDKTGLRTFADVNDILDKLKELKGK